MLKNKKAQYIAFVTLVLIFVFVSVVFLFTDTISQQLTSEEDLFQIIQRENDRLSTSITMTGYPNNWNKTTVERIGFISNNRLNETKITQARQIAKHDYNDFKTKMGANYDVKISIQDPQLGTTEIGFIDSDTNIVVSTQRQLINSGGAPVDVMIWSSVS